MSNQSAPAVMNVEEVAAYLRVAPATIYRLAKRGEIPGAKVGRSWRFQKEVIDRWLEEQADANLSAEEASSPDASQVGNEGTNVSKNRDAS